MTIYTTVEIAALVKKSERTVQLWIQKGTLKAQRIQGNRYEVDERDLEPFLPRAITDSLMARIEALEQRMSELEGKLQENPITHARPSPAPYATRERSQGDTLPPELVSYPQFARLHTIGVSTTQKAIESGRLQAVHGEWKQGRAIVKTALDASGRQRFYELYHENEHFTACDACPH